MSRGPKLGKLFLTVALWMALGFSLTLVAAMTLPNLLGYRSTTVLTGSMRPVLTPGDMAVGKWIRADQARAGDIITFKSTERGGKLVTHRVRSAQRDGSKINVVTKGDANDSVERWSVPPNGRVSRVVVDVPKAGYAASWISGPKGRIMFVVIPALLLCIFELVRIWRPQRDDENEPVNPTTAGGAHA